MEEETNEEVNLVEESKNAGHKEGIIIISGEVNSFKRDLYRSVRNILNLFGA